MAATGGSSWGLGVTFYLIGSVSWLTGRLQVSSVRFKGLVVMSTTLLTTGSCSSARVRENKTLWPRFCRWITNLQTREEREKDFYLFYQSKASLERLTWGVKVFRGHRFCVNTAEMDSREETRRSVEVGSRWRKKLHHISWSTWLAACGNHFSSREAIKQQRWVLILVPLDSKSLQTHVFWWLSAA